MSIREKMVLKAKAQRCPRISYGFAPSMLRLTLAKARNFRDVSQQALAAELGISVPTMVKFEKDLSLMRVGMIQHAAEFLGMKFVGDAFILADTSALDTAGGAS